MVRILKVTRLEERRRELLKRSDLYRQTMQVELSNLSYSASLVRQKFKSAKSTLVWLGAAAPLAGFLLGRRRGAEPEAEGEGWLGKMRSGAKVFGLLWPLLRKFAPGRSPVEENGEA